MLTPGGVSQGSDKGLQPGIDELRQALHGPRSVHQRVEVPPQGPQPPPIHLKRSQPQAMERQDRPLHRSIWWRRGSQVTLLSL